MDNQTLPKTGRPVAEPRWLSAEEQWIWRSFIEGKDLLWAFLEQDLDSIHLSLFEYEILVRLSEAKDRSLRMADLAGALKHSRSRVTHAVGRLEKRGWVARENCEEDGRGVRCRLTEFGFTNLHEAAKSHVQAVRENMFDVADPEDLKALGRVMDAVREHLNPR